MIEWSDDDCNEEPDPLASIYDADLPLELVETQQDQIYSRALIGHGCYRACVNYDRLDQQ